MKKFRITIDMIIEANSDEEAVEMFSDGVCTGDVIDEMDIEEVAEKHDAYVETEIKNYKEWFKRFTT